MVEPKPAVLDREQTIGRRAAVGVLATVAAALIIGPLLTAGNLAFSEVGGRKPNVELAPGVRVIDQWRDSLPVDLPWWAFLAVSLAFAVLLAVVWDPRRHYSEFWRRKVILMASPNSIALMSLVWAFMAVGFGGYYTARDDWQGFVYIPALVALAVTVVGLVLTMQFDHPKKRRRRLEVEKNG